MYNPITPNTPNTMSKEIKSNPTEEVTELIDAQQPARDEAQANASVEIDLAPGKHRTRWSYRQ